MNKIAKKAASDKLQAAIAREKVTTQKAGLLIGIKPIYISMFKNPKHWRSIGNPQWEKLTKWVNSGESLKNYLVRHPEAALPADEHIETKTEKIFKEKKESFATPPENIAQGDPASDDEITDVEFEDPIQDKNAFEKLSPEARKNLIDEVKMRLAQDKRTLHEFIKRNATVIITKDDNHYYFLPYWFLDTKEGSYELYPLGRLPEDLKEAIKNLRGE